MSGKQLGFSLLRAKRSQYQWLINKSQLSSARQNVLVHSSQAQRWLHASPSLKKMDVKMPSLSPTMTEGTIVKWAKQEGEEVAAGDVLCEIQTDKAVVALEADDDGVLAKILVSENSGAMQVGSLIAVMAEDGEDWKEVNSSAVGSGAAAGGSADSQEAEESGPTGGSTPGTEVKMPSLSPTMTEGTIVKWNKQEGETINAGDVLCEIQTDKAVVAMEADDDAILAKILVPENESGIVVGDLIALTVEEGQDWKDVQIPAKKKEAKLDEAPVETMSEAPSTSTAPPLGPTATAHKFEHVSNVGPATNLLLAQYGIKADQVESTGPKGLLKYDVLSHIKKNNLQPIQIAAEPSPSAQGSASSAPAAPSKSTERYIDIPLTSMRGTIAKRLTQSKQTSPHGHATAAANIDAVLALRKEFAARGVKVSVNDFVIKAVSTALQYVPELNLNISGDDFQIMSNVDVSIAVATDAGLITPIVKDVPNKSLDQISAEVKDLAGKARQNKLQLHEFQGGTFTISNLGMFGIHEFTAIINPPQAGILAVGSGFTEINPETGKPCTVMRSTLSFDRRFVDEAAAADFMSTLQKVLEKPEYMNLGLLPTARRDRSAAFN